MTKLEDEILKEPEYKPYLWWRYIDDIFFLWEHGKNKLKSFIDKINKVLNCAKSAKLLKIR